MYTSKLASKKAPMFVQARWYAVNMLARHLYTYVKGVKSVELFGSLARGEGDGNSDFDLVIVVDVLTADLWFSKVYDIVETPNNPFYGTRSAVARRWAAFKLLGVNSEDLEIFTGVNPEMLDIFLFPPYWKKRLEELQQLGWHEDPLFMWNIAHDARTLVPIQSAPFTL